MKRRSFLAMFGLAPVAVSMPALSGNQKAANIGYARTGIEVRTASGGAFRSSALFLDVPDTSHLPPKVIFKADRFVVANAGDGWVSVEPKA